MSEYIEAKCSECGAGFYRPRNYNKATARQTCGDNCKNERIARTIRERARAYLARQEIADMQEAV